MKTRMIQHEEATNEFIHYITYLSEKASYEIALGFDFEIDEKLKEIREHPDRFPLAKSKGKHKTIRKAGPTKIHRFSIYYAWSNNLIVVLAITHPKREPNYWAAREY